MVWSALIIFLTNLIVYLIKNRENFLCLCSIACRIEQIEYRLKSQLYLSSILKLEFFEVQSCPAVIWLVIKLFSTPQSLSRVSLSQKKYRVFPNLLLFLIYLFRQYLTQIVRPAPLPTIINVVCKYLRQLPGRSLSDVTLLRSWNIE